jgi:hypothetical protein
MKRTLKILFIAMTVLATGCGSPSENGAVTVKVKAVEQVSNYTYLLVKGKGPEYWIAVSTTEIEVGEKITYQGGGLMVDFYSKELDRTFDEIVFLDGFEGEQDKVPAMGQMPGTTQGSVETDKLDTKIKHNAGTISIGDLYSDPAAYEGKSIRVKGEVAKFNAQIMERNWVHLQDGTEFEGKYDLTVTSQEQFAVGQVVTLEGVLALNRDFGYGYNYEILLEKATLVE